MKSNPGTRITLWTASLAALLAVMLAFPAPSALGLTSAERADLEKDIERLNKEVQPFTELFSKTIQMVMPSVVSISTTKKVTVPGLSLGPDMPFDQFPFRFRMPQGEEQEREVTGLGSGFVIDAENGYVVTNYHVVDDVEAKDIKIALDDGRELVAESVLKDQKTEVAIIKVEPDGLVGLEWGDSNDIEVGQWVIAIGSPMGFGNTATTGIISAVSTKGRVFGGGRRTDLRVIQNPYAVEDYIQTDTAINPGNSGGPLITLTGKVIGINTLIVSRSGASAGLGFAVPERIGRPVVDALVRHGRVVRGHLGVSIINPADITDASAGELFGMDTADEVLRKYKLEPDAEGVVIAQMLPGGPADEADIRVGDLIVKIGDTPTPDVDTLRDLVAATAPGTKVAVALLREGERETLDVTIGEQPSDASAWAMGGPGESANETRLGLSVQSLTPDVAEALGYPRGLQGVVITEVRPDSPAAAAKLRVNDVVVGVGRTDVSNVGEFLAAVGKMGPRGAALRIKRGDQTMFVPVRP